LVLISLVMMDVRMDLILAACSDIFVHICDSFSYSFYGNLDPIMVLGRNFTVTECT
jgi:hypothetical protein